jgi:hypothetical protein
MMRIRFGFDSPVLAGVVHTAQFKISKEEIYRVQYTILTSSQVIHLIGEFVLLNEPKVG